MAALHFTAGRLRKLLEEMCGSDVRGMKVILWEELAKLVRLGTLVESEEDVVISLMQLILLKCKRDQPQVKALGFRIFQTVLLDSSYNVRSFLDLRARLIVFLMLRSTVENKNSPDSIVVRTLANAILFKLFRQTFPAVKSFQVLLEAYDFRSPDIIFEADYPKYFNWIVSNAEENEITREQLKQFLKILERRWSIKKDYDRLVYGILLKEMQNKFPTNILPDEKNALIRLIGTSSSEKVLGNDPDDPITWVNYNNWTIPRYWIPKQTKESKRSSEQLEPMCLEIKNSHNAETVKCTSPVESSMASSYCFDCLEKKQMSQEHEDQQSAAPTADLRDTKSSIRRVEWKKPAKDAPNLSVNKTGRVSQPQRNVQPTPIVQRRVVSINVKPVEEFLEQESNQGLRIRSMSGSHSKSAIPEKTRRSLG